MSKNRELPWQLGSTSQDLPVAHNVTGPTVVRSNVVQVVFGATRSVARSSSSADGRSTVLNQVLRKAELLDW